MMHALTLSALFGTWMCASQGQPDMKSVYVFGRDGTLSISSTYRRQTPIVNCFRYSVSDGYLMVRNSNNQLMRDDVTVHEGRWTATPSGFQDRCKRRPRS
jgi:hypothetical protein